MVLLSIESQSQRLVSLLFTVPSICECGSEMLCVFVYIYVCERCLGRRRLMRLQMLIYREFKTQIIDDDSNSFLVE